MIIVYYSLSLMPIRECLFDISVCKVHYRVPIRPLFPSHSILKYDLFLALSVQSVNFSILLFNLLRYYIFMVFTLMMIGRLEAYFIEVLICFGHSRLIFLHFILRIYTHHHLIVVGSSWHINSINGEFFNSCRLMISATFDLAGWGSGTMQLASAFANGWH